MDVLVVDIGGTHVKLYSHGDEPSRFDSGPGFKPDDLVARAQEHLDGWHYDVVSIGYPGRVGHKGPVAEPGNLGGGWVDFDFEKAFGAPTRIVNDAALQALGAYKAARMLFLGFGTGLGSALVADHVIVPLELGCIPYRDKTLFEYVGRQGLDEYGEEAWLETVNDVVRALREAFAADECVLGGGNVERIEQLPPQTRRGGNDDAFTGGVRLWEEEVEHHDRPPSSVWRVVR